MDAKTVSSIMGHYSVAFTLDTYAHVLDSHKREEMMKMQNLFTPAQISECQSYPVIVAITQRIYPKSVDFEDLSIESDNLQYGIDCLQIQLSDNCKYQSACTYACKWTYL